MILKGLLMVVSECFVGFGYMVNVFMFFNCSIFVVCSISEFVCQVQSYGFIIVFMSSFNDLMYCQGIMMDWMNFNWNLISRIIYVVGFNFDSWVYVFECNFEGFQFRFIRMLSQGFQCVVYDSFCSRFFIIYYQDIDKFSQQF